MSSRGEGCLGPASFCRDASLRGLPTTVRRGSSCTSSVVYILSFSIFMSACSPLIDSATFPIGQTFAFESNESTRLAQWLPAAVCIQKCIVHLLSSSLPTKNSDCSKVCSELRLSKATHKGGQRSIFGLRVKTRLGGRPRKTKGPGSCHLCGPLPTRPSARGLRVGASDNADSLADNTPRLVR